MGSSHALGKERSDLLEGTVLKQSGKEEITRLKESEILFVLNLATGEETRRLEIKQGRCHDEEAAGLIQIPESSLPSNVGDELVRHLMKGKFGHLKLVLGDQLQQQIEGALESPDMDRKAGRVVS